MKVDDFPIEVRHLMLYRQQEQKGKRDWSLFQNYPANVFNWHITPEKWNFWNHVINHEDFNVFYVKYPKVDYPKDMPEEIIMLALDRRVEQNWPKGDEKSFGFWWSDTPEKFDFWNSIHNGNYSVYYKKYGFLGYIEHHQPPLLFYKGEIADFPPEVVELMLQRQFEQTGKRNVYVFEYCKDSAVEKGGFEWRKSPEDFYFWNNVINHKNFNLFFEKYPKQQTIINSHTKTNQNETNSEKNSKTTISKAIEVSTVVATISKGKRPTSVGISGRRSKTAIGSGHISYKAVFGF